MSTISINQVNFLGNLGIPCGPFADAAPPPRRTRRPPFGGTATRQTHCMKYEDWRRDQRALIDAPVISDLLLAQLRAVPPTGDGIEYRPCRVCLDDGSWQDHVYVQEVDSWLYHRGAAPATDGRREVPFARVQEIRDSASRLPVDIAQTLYRAGETNMGGISFALITRGAQRITAEAGGAVDFVDLPEGIAPSDIVGVEPHARDARFGRHRRTTLPFAWCLYSLPEDIESTG